MTQECRKMIFLTTSTHLRKNKLRKRRGIVVIKGDYGARVILMVLGSNLASAHDLMKKYSYNFQQTNVSKPV